MVVEFENESSHQNREEDEGDRSYGNEEDEVYEDGEADRNGEQEMRDEDERGNDATNEQGGTSRSGEYPLFFCSI